MFSKAATLKVFPKRKRSQITMIEIDGTIEDKGTIWLYCDLMHTYVCISTYVCHLNILAKNELQIYKKWRKALQYGSVAMNEDNPHRKVTFD